MHALLRRGGGRALTRGTRQAPGGERAGRSAGPPDGGPDPAASALWTAAAAPRRPPRRRLGRLVGLYLITVFLVASLVFWLPRALPGDPLTAYVDDTTGPLSDEMVAELRRFHGLDGTRLEQYGRYLGRLARGDLGDSIASSQPVTSLVGQNLPWTVLLMGTALTLSSILSFRAGVSAAWRRGSRRDRRLQAGSTVLRAMPDYAIGTFLLIAFGVVWQVLPISGSSTPFTTSESFGYKLVDVARHLVLPGTALTLALIGNKFLMVRNLTVGALGQDYMLLARAKGLPEQLQRRHHAGRNALLPYLNFVGVQVGAAVGGSVFIETIFGYRGMGRLMVNAVNSRDYQVIESCFLVLALLVLTTNLVIDLLSAYVDPRVKAE